MIGESVCTGSKWGGRSDCRYCAIRERVLFGGLSSHDLEGVHTVIDDLVFQPNGVVYQEGETGHALFTIRRGLIKLVSDLSDGEERIVRLLRVADVAGIEAFVGAEYKHTAIAMCETAVCRIPLRVVEDLVSKHQSLTRQLMLRWQGSLDDADRGLVDFSTGPAEARVARLLLHLSDRSDNSTCQDLCRKDMGALLGVTTETVSRVMAKFKRSGIVVDIPGRSLCRCDREILGGISAHHWRSKTPIRSVSPCPVRAAFSPSCAGSV